MPQEVSFIQELLNRVAHHLMSQGCKSTIIDPAGCTKCRYRGGTTGQLKCAVGCLIDDKYYSESLELKAVAHGQVLLALELSLDVSDLSGPAIGVLRDLQHTHDNYGVESWPQRIRCIARSRNLEIPDCAKERV